MDSTEQGISISLFERSTLHEWEASIPAEDATSDTGWPGVGQFLRLFGAKSLSESLLFYVSQFLRWKVAYSTVHHSIAVQKDGSLEIWRDYCSVPVSKCRILDDEHPQWCKLAWSASGNLLFSSRSNGALDAFDVTGGFCFTIPLTTSEGGFDPLYSVATILSVAYTADTAWSDRLWILQYDGSLRYYLTGRVSGYHPLSVINVNGDAASVAITAILLLNANAILIASHHQDGNTTQSSADIKTIASRDMSIWRITDSEPYLVPFGNDPGEVGGSSVVGQKRSFVLFNAPKEYILQIAVNADETLAACFTSRGDLIAFRIPSLQILKTWSLGDELSARRENASFISGVGWWSQKELMLLYSTGFVATVNLDSDGTTSAVDKNYCPWTQLICVTQGHVLLMEISDHRKLETTQKQTWTSFVWPMVRMPYALLKLAAQAFVGAPLTAVEDARTKAEVLPCRYILHEMKAITPAELFKKKLVAGNYDEALAIAETYCLNADRVYQEQWRKNPVTLDTINNYLAKVTSRNWVIDECLSQIPDSLDACRKLLEIGLQLTEDLKAVKSESDLQPRKQECLARYRLVKYLQVLIDYEAMLTIGTRAEDFDNRYYKEMRDLSLYDWALKLARGAYFTRLGVLISKYGQRFYPIWLVLLSNIPEIVDIEEYEFLLPKFDKRPDWTGTSDTMDMDFIFTEPFSKYADIKHDDISKLLPEKSILRVFVISLDGKDSDINLLMKNWYEFRAMHIERCTCLPDLAERFLAVASANKFTDFEELREDMGLLRLLNYDCSLSAHVSYERLKKMSPLDVLRLLLKEAPKEVFLQRFEQWAVPFCMRWQQRTNSPAKTLIWQYVVSVSDESLKIALLLFQSFKTKSEFWAESIDLTRTDIIRLAADCLSACGDYRQIDSGFQLISYLPQLSDDDAEASIVQSMEDHLTALHLLNVYGIALSYEKLLKIASSHQESTLLLKRLVRYGTSATLKSDIGRPVGDKSTTVRIWTVDDWQTLLKDMIQISRAALPSVAEHRCHEIFVEGLLSSKSMELIDLASEFLVISRNGKKQDVDVKKKLLVPKLSYDSAVELISEAAEAYINEAMDSRDESLTYARKCLTLLENAPDKLIRQTEFIEALPILEFFGIQELPARLKLYKNPLRLIEDIFTRKPTAYGEYEKLIKLCKLLRIPTMDINDERNLLVICAKKSLEQKDGSSCVRFCKDIISNNCKSGWRVCWDACTELCTTPYFKSDIRYQLLLFCLMHCDDSYLEPILDSLRGLKMELLKKSLVNVKNQSNVIPSIQSTWNEIKKKVKIPNVQDWRMDTVYFDPINYNPKNETRPFDEDCVHLLNFLRLLLLNEESDRNLLDDVWAQLGKSTLFNHTHLALMAMLNVKNDQILDKLLKSIPTSPMLLEIALYTYGLRAFIRSGIDGLKFEMLLKVKPEILTTEAYSIFPHDVGVKEWARKLNSYWMSMTVVDLPEGVDRNRFDDDEQYRKDTIIGLALTVDEASYDQALELAENHGVESWQVNVAHLEFLFTEAELDASELSEAIKTRRLLEKLSQRRQETFERMSSNVFPLLDGRDHQKMLLFYAVQAKLGPESEAATINGHRVVLKQLKPLAEGIDYKKLVSVDEDALDVLLPYLNAENFPTFAKAITRIPNKTVTLDELLYVWAKKVFLETLQKVNIKTAFDRCKKVLEKLTADYFLRFVKDIVFKTKSTPQVRIDDVRVEFIQLCIEYASQREKFGACTNQLKDWERQISGD